MGGPPCSTITVTKSGCAICLEQARHLLDPLARPRASLPARTRGPHGSARSARRVEACLSGSAPYPSLRHLPYPVRDRKSTTAQRSHGRSHRAAGRASTYQEMTDEQKAIVEMVRQFVDKEILPNAEEYDHEDKFPEPIVEQMKELGLFGVTIPEEYGGHGPRPHDLRDDRRGALARLDLDLRRRQHPLHRLLPADEVRHRRAEGVLPAEDGDRRDPRRLLALGARGRLRRPGDQVDAPRRTTTATGS